jgi:hypothetical protein
MAIKTGTYSLRLSSLLTAMVEKLGKREGTCVNQFLVVAVAEKLSVMATTGRRTVSI